MRIGFVGAGKVGCSLGAYLAQRCTLVGYASKNPESAREAAALTNSAAYDSALELCKECDALFFTTPDGAIAEAWHEVRDNAPAGALTGKMICHCSGAQPSTVFDGARDCGATAYSLHPLFAIPSKTVGADELSRAFFALEGDAEHLEDLKSLIAALGNDYQVIDAAEKTRYHAAAAMASNHMVALYRLASNELVRCGFTPDGAERALAPLFLGNAQHVAQDGTTASLTGPAERGDMATIDKHLSCLDGSTREVYRLLNEVLLDIAAEKHGQKR